MLSTLLGRIDVHLDKRSRCQRSTVFALHQRVFLLNISQQISSYPGRLTPPLPSWFPAFLLDAACVISLFFSSAQAIDLEDDNRNGISVYRFKSQALFQLEFGGGGLFWGDVQVIVFIFGRVRKNCEKLLLASSCLSVRVEQLACHWTNFHKISYLRNFRKSAKKIQVPLKSANNNRYFTRKPIYSFDHISLSSS